MMKIIFFLLIILFTFQLKAQSEPDTLEMIEKHIKSGGDAAKSGNVGVAISHYFTAQKLSESGKYSEKLAETLQLLGRLYEEYYRYEEALDYHKKSLSIWTEIRRSDKIAKSANDVAWCFLKTGIPDSSVVYSALSVKNYELSGQSSDFVRYCMALESYSESLILTGNLSEAGNVLHQAMSIGVKNKSDLVIGFINYGYAFLFYNQKNYEKASTAILKCMPVAEKYAAGRMLLDVYELSYKIHDELKDSPKAFYYLKKSNGLFHKLAKEDVEKKSAIVQANYELSKKETDLKLLEQKNNIQNLEIERQSFIRNGLLGGIVIMVIIGSLIFGSIKNKRKYELLDLQRKSSELDQARRFQLSLLPKSNFRKNGFSVAGKMKTATEVGGDYFDFFELDNDRICVVLGDATGHGMMAGLLVSMAKVTLMSSRHILAEKEDLTTVIKMINDSFRDSLDVKGVGMGLQIALINRQRNYVKMTSHGMPFPIIVNKTDGNLTTIKLKNPPLGFFRKITVTEMRRDFTENEFLIFASDGISERFNSQNLEYGDERLMETIRRFSASAECSEIIDAVFDDSEKFAEKLPNHDDMTMVAACFAS